jgi:hypothetical protein
MRSKQEYVLEVNDKGKQTPKKVGMAPVQREGMEYEFTVMLDVDMHHIASASKDRTSLFDGQFFKIGQATGEMLLTWLETGAEMPPPPATVNTEPKKQVGPAKTALVDTIDRKQAGNIADALKAAQIETVALFEAFCVSRLGEIKIDQLDTVNTWILENTAKVEQETGELLQTVYALIGTLAEKLGETPDDCIGTLTNNKLTVLIDLEEKSAAYLNDLKLQVENAIALLAR